MIEHDVPIPTNRPNAHPPLPREVLAEMQVGSSVHIAGGKQEAQKARTAAYMFGKLKGWKFMSRTEGNGIRIWRTA